MKESTDFYYDSISSAEMGLVSVQVSTGLYEEQFLSDREIQEVSIRGRDKPYFQGIKRSPLILTLQFAFEEMFDEDKIRNVARWLSQSSFKAFYTVNNPGRIYYCMLQSSSKLLHDGLCNGYIELEMRCDAPWTYSPEYNSQEYDFSSNTEDGTILDFVNYGDIECYPEIWITKIGNGDISIVNTSNGGFEFKFTSLLDTEELYIDCENEQIESILPDQQGNSDGTIQYRYDNFNDNYMEFVRGLNRLIVYGNCKLSFRYCFRTLQGA